MNFVFELRWLNRSDGSRVLQFHTKGGWKDVPTENEQVLKRGDIGLVTEVLPVLHSDR